MVSRAERKFPRHSVVEAFERAVGNARWLDASHSAHVAAGRILAARVDELEENGFLDDRGKLDNVSLPTFLKTLTALGLDVAEVRGTKQSVKPLEPDTPSLDGMRKGLRAVK